MSAINTLATYTAAQAMQTLRDEMALVEDYAWTWHCNIAVLLMDEGVEWMKANERAASFMHMAFNVDTLSRARQIYEDFQVDGGYPPTMAEEARSRILEL